MSPADQSQRQVPMGEGVQCQPRAAPGWWDARWVPRVGERIWGVVTATASLTVLLGTAWKGMPGQGGGCLLSVFARSGAGCGQVSAQGSGEAQAGKGGLHHCVAPLHPRACEQNCITTLPFFGNQTWGQHVSEFNAFLWTSSRVYCTAFGNVQCFPVNLQILVC